MRLLNVIIRRLAAFRAAPAPRVVAFGAALLLLLAPADAAKTPDAEQPPKPDKVEKTGKAEKVAKPEKYKAEKAGKTARSVKADAVAPPPTAATGRPASFEAFETIVDRNIFNPNRTGRTRALPDQPPPRMESFALVGTLESEDGRLAFFDSPDPMYQKVVAEGESIAGMTVRRITATAVQLATEERPIGLRVNQQLRRVEGGTWRVAPREAPGGEIAFSAGTAGMPPVPPGASEVLRRLMEQRQQQLKQ
jgi:hypothetical protein